jgi:hypothetical protein
MLTVFNQIALATICLVTIFLAQAPAQPADSAADPVGKAWKARAEAATKRLASAGLDKCDRGLELAFQQPNQVASGTQRSFELPVEIDRQAMVASYSYEGPRLTSFVLLALPPGWLAVQKTDSKTLNILVTGSNCSFDLCTSDPFAAGPCAK